MLDNIDIDAISALLSSGSGAKLIKGISSNPDLHEDIYAITSKRVAVAQFERNLSANLKEPDWQAFFEQNPWIFGHGLNYVFLDKVGNKLENTTTGSAFDNAGKRVDGLMRTRAEISQYVLVEIKRPDTNLLQENSSYRPGCWGVSHELSNAITQVQKTVFEFAKNRFHDILKDEKGNNLRDVVYSVEPRSFLVVGNLSQLVGNNDKVACFELYGKTLCLPRFLHSMNCIIVRNVSWKISVENPMIVQNNRRCPSWLTKP
jgi:hypothetical protein